MSDPTPESHLVLEPELDGITADQLAREQHSEVEFDYLGRACLARPSPGGCSTITGVSVTGCLLSALNGPPSATSLGLHYRIGHAADLEPEKRHMNSSNAGARYWD